MQSKVCPHVCNDVSLLCCPCHCNVSAVFCPFLDPVALTNQVEPFFLPADWSGDGSWSWTKPAEVVTIATQLFRDLKNPALAAKCLCFEHSQCHNLLCVVKLEGRELQLQIQATLCAEKHTKRQHVRHLFEWAHTHQDTAPLTCYRFQVELWAGLIVTVDIQERCGFVTRVLQEFSHK